MTKLSEDNQILVNAIGSLIDEKIKDLAETTLVTKNDIKHLPTKEEYIANNLNEEEIAKSIDADLVIYQDLDELVEAVSRKGDVKFSQPCTACFSGHYPTGDVTEAVLTEIESQRKQERETIEEKGAVMF